MKNKLKIKLEKIKNYFFNDEQKRMTDSEKGLLTFFIIVWFFAIFVSDIVLGITLSIILLVASIVLFSEDLSRITRFSMVFIVISSLYLNFNLDTVKSVKTEIPCEVTSYKDEFYVKYYDRHINSLKIKSYEKIPKCSNYVMEEDNILYKKLGITHNDIFYNLKCKK